MRPPVDAFCQEDIEFGILGDVKISDQNDYN